MDKPKSLPWPNWECPWCKFKLKEGITFAITEPHAQALMELCEMAKDLYRYNVTDAKALQSFAESIWQEIFENES